MSFRKLDYTHTPAEREPVAVDGAKPIALKGLSNMIALHAKPIPWIFDGFIVDQDQVLIAGAAKTGKSWLALDLAVAAATGGKFLRWAAARRFKTLYVNMEVGSHMWSRRVIKQLGGVEKAEALAAQDVPFFTCDDIKTLDANDPNSVRSFAAFIKENAFEFVVFDVLARCHNVDENLNGEMQRTLLNLRLMAPGCTTVVVHHARKPPQGSEHVNLGAASVRGASAIVGEVDLAMILTTRTGPGARFSLTFAARNVEMPDELLLDRSDDDMRYVEHQGEDHDLDAILGRLFKTGYALQRKEVQQAVADGAGVAFETARKLVKGAVERGLIEESRQGKRYFYFVPESSPILRVVGCSVDEYDAASNGDDCPF